MATYAGAAAAILTVVSVSAWLWVRTIRRIAALQHELDDVYRAHRILERAQARKDRKHLKLLVIPLAWMVGRLHAAPARLAAATAVSAMVTGASVVSVDGPVHAPRTVTPPAGAETTVPEPAHGTPLEYQSTIAPPAAAVAAKVAAEVSQTPAPSAAMEVETASDSPPVSSPSTTTTTTSTTTSTTSTTVLEAVVPRVCVNPVPADLHLCPASSP
jgi:hypothetical protein